MNPGPFEITEDQIRRLGPRFTTFVNKLLEEGELQERVNEAVRDLPPADRLGLIGLLDREVPAAWELGRALAASERAPNEFVAALTDRFDVNPNALVGYLHGLVESGDIDAFDRFLEGPHAGLLAPQVLLKLAVRGPVTDVSRRRISDGVAMLPVRDAAAAMFGWARNLSTHDTASLVEDWIARTTTQDDYNAAVDWLNLTLLNSPAPPELLDPIWRLVRSRASYPKMGRNARDWVTLAIRVADDHALDLLVLLLKLIEHDRLMIHSGAPEATLLGHCLKRQPVLGWAELAARLQDAGAWRLPMQLRGWVQFFLPIEVVDAWIGQDLDRARIVAAITSPGGAEPTALAVLLLDRFGNDQQISASLRATYVSGAWWGPWSNWLTSQIEQLTAWQDNAELPIPVRRWAKDMDDSLRLERDAALEREAEEGENRRSGSNPLRPGPTRPGLTSSTSSSPRPHRRQPNGRYRQTRDTGSLGAIFNAYGGGPEGPTWSESGGCLPEPGRHHPPRRRRVRRATRRMGRRPSPHKTLRASRKPASRSSTAIPRR